MFRQYLQFFRVLLPGWRFFDRRSQAVTFWIRFQEAGAWSDWEERLRLRRGRKWHQVFLNSHQNYVFAARSLLEQLIEDLRAGVTDSASEALVTHLAEFEAKARLRSSTGFQFRVCLDGHDVYVSVPQASASPESEGSLP